MLDLLSFRRRHARAVPSVPVKRGGDVIVIVAGLALYVAFVFWLHVWLIGRTVMG
ncbi:NnrU protein [Modicisalibacter ilicicola DSM 19980]|uniref:NnrU protein n=1 Tax=Modicisalibacter ilicicola DSM 19980 TaxID=1121942 RepID=A0A1M5D5X7_9GAMM|nr:hypothetical protein [Halomonas ilicicola]SHF62473.1 NnrU protein [Halomonas ilicicola DSM 19980]